MSEIYRGDRAWQALAVMVIWIAGFFIIQSGQDAKMVLGYMIGGTVVTLIFF